MYYWLFVSWATDWKNCIFMRVCKKVIKVDHLLRFNPHKSNTLDKWCRFACRHDFIFSSKYVLDIGCTMIVSHTVLYMWVSSNNSFTQTHWEPRGKPHEDVSWQIIAAVRPDCNSAWREPTCEGYHNWGMKAGLSFWWIANACLQEFYPESFRSPSLGPRITLRAWKCWNRGLNSHICNLSCSAICSFIILHNHQGTATENTHIGIVSSSDIITSLLSIMVRP